MINEMIQDSDVKLTLEFTERMIQTSGERLAGSPGSKKAADSIKKEFESYCDSVTTEKFTFSPNAFLGYIRLLVILYVISTVFLWIQRPFYSVVLISIGILTMVMEFFFYKEFIDPLWQKKTGHNVIGTIEPEDEVKQQIIISGHHDCAYVFNFLYYQPKLYPLRLYGGLGSVFLMFLIPLIWSIFKLITGREPLLGTIWKITATILLLLVLQMWFFRGNKGTPGAGDNMIAVAVANQMGHIIATAKKSGQPLKHTRIILGSWDAEEAGLRGARAYCKLHEDELKKIPTYNFNMDCLYSLDDLFFLTTDINGSVNLSEKMAKECEQIAHQKGYKATKKPIAFLTGGTDAGEFGKIGVEATSLIAMPWGNDSRASVYHTPDDKVEAIEPEIVKASLKILYEYCMQKDQKISI
ncbi:M28 family peptidase [Candidatus Lokiarchaeum ossiferum]|uniref:M28 family peptidase n=1 Tax=Candidatus Lokiarchaeum ossiferum TaxID=2951803 RepID=UPI00352DEDB8